MARGFATGLFHGALTGAVGLAALSLLLPAPDPGGDALVPDAAVIATPAGSEFGRGEDAQPLLPAPLTRPAPAPLGGSGSVDAPPDGADAPLTDASTVTADRPETRAEDPLAPPEIAPVTADADIPAAPPADSRAAPAAPERFESPAPDVEPLPLIASEPEDPGDDESPALTSPAVMPPPLADLPVVRPGLPEPPAAESPADMSALTRGRPEDGLGEDGLADADAPAEESPAEDRAGAPDAAAAESGLSDSAPSGNAPATSDPETAEQAVAAEDDTGQPEPDQPEPAADAGPEAETDAVQPEAVTDAQPDQPAPQPGVESLVADDSQNGARSGARDYPAMNLSTPPDIGGLLAGP